MLGNSALFVHEATCWVTLLSHSHCKAKQNKLQVFHPRFVHHNVGNWQSGLSPSWTSQRKRTKPRRRRKVAYSSKPDFQPWLSEQRNHRQRFYMVCLSLPTCSGAMPAGCLNYRKTEFCLAVKCQPSRFAEYKGGKWIWRLYTPSLCSK